MATSSVKPRWTYWAVAGLALIWNVMGCMNYLGQTSAETIADLPAAYQAVVADRPIWATAGFAIAVFGGALGAVLMVLRLRLAMAFFAISCLGAVVELVHVASVTQAPNILAATGMSVVIAALLAWYTRRSKVLARS